MAAAGRTLAWDWYAGTIPENVSIDPTAYVETSYSFFRYRSEAPVGVRLGRGSATYPGTMFDLGPAGRVSLGDYAFSHGAWFICDAEIEIGDYTMISWNVVFMDAYRVPFDPEERHRELERAARRGGRLSLGGATARPIRVGRNVWIGFDVCVLPGVSIGDGSIIGARSVVVDNIPSYSVAAGNPARVIRSLEAGENTRDAH
jgi:acetyltransferase-like isoleucine patch superfamily enzyme